MEKANGGIRIAIVDDDVLLTKTLDMLLEEKGYSVNIFNRGVDAVRYFFDELPDVALMNSRLPDCTGWFIVKLLQKLDNSGKLYIIFLSVIEADGKLIEGIKNTVFLAKPFDTGKLLEIIDRRIKAQYLSINT